MSTHDHIDRIFAPIADAVGNFALQNSFNVEKCARGNSGWELTHPHAEGGIVYLLLLHDPSLGLGIGSVWQFSCPEMSMQYSHFRKINPCPLVPEQVIGVLEKELQEITSIRFGYWTHMQQLSVNE